MLAEDGPKVAMGIAALFVMLVGYALTAFVPSHSESTAGPPVPTSPTFISPVHSDSYAAAPVRTAQIVQAGGPPVTINPLEFRPSFPISSPRFHGPEPVPARGPFVYVLPASIPARYSDSVPAPASAPTAAESISYDSGHGPDSSVQPAAATADQPLTPTVGAPPSPTGDLLEQGLRLPGEKPLWLTSLHLDPDRYIKAGKLAGGRGSNPRGLWLYEATLYNPSDEAIWIVPCRLAFDDNSSYPLYRGTGEWLQGDSAGTDQRTGPGQSLASWTPAPASSVYVELKPHAATSLLLFANANASFAASSPTVLTGTAQSPGSAGPSVETSARRNPRAILIVQVPHPDNEPMVLASGSASDRLNQAAALARQIEGSGASATHREIPVTDEVLSRFKTL